MARLDREIAEHRAHRTYAIRILFKRYGFTIREITRLLKFAKEGVVRSALSGTEDLGPEERPSSLGLEDGDLHWALELACHAQRCVERKGIARAHIIKACGLPSPDDTEAAHDKLRGNTRWTDEEVTVAANLKLSDLEVARLISRSKGAVRALRRRMHFIRPADR